MHCPLLLRLIEARALIPQWYFTCFRCLSAQNWVHDMTVNLQWILPQWISSESCFNEASIACHQLYILTFKWCYVDSFRWNGRCSCLIAKHLGVCCPLYSWLSSPWARFRRSFRAFGLASGPRTVFCRILLLLTPHCIQRRGTCIWEFTVHSDLYKVYHAVLAYNCFNFTSIKHYTSG